MRNSFLPILAICLVVCTAAQAQMGGGHGGGGHRGRGGGHPSDSSAPPARPDPAPVPRQKATDQIEIVGVIRAIGPEPDRVTIAYDAVEDLSWPAGTMPFTVAKSALLKDATVGEKVRFRLESHQISYLSPF